MSFPQTEWSIFISIFNTLFMIFWKCIIEFLNFFVSANCFIYNIIEQFEQSKRDLMIVIHIHLARMDRVISSNSNRIKHFLSSWMDLVFFYKVSDILIDSITRCV